LPCTVLTETHCGADLVVNITGTRTKDEGPRTKDQEPGASD
jgi:hypothetical protein